VAKRLLINHLLAIESALHLGGLSAAQRSVLQNTVAQLGAEGLDWRSAIKRELEIPQGLNPQSSSAIAKIIPAYVGALTNPARLPDLQKMVASAPKPCSDIIPNPQRVLEAKQELTDKLRDIRLKLQ
jgi:hypothetical protein